MIYSTGQCVPNVFGHRVLLGLKNVHIEPKKGLAKILAIIKPHMKVQWNIFSYQNTITFNAQT